MSVVIIENIDKTSFRINGKLKAKEYEPFRGVVLNDGRETVGLTATNKNEKIQHPITYDLWEVDGNTFTSVTELEDALQKVTSASLGSVSIKTLTISDFITNNYTITDDDMRNVDILKVDSNANVSITFPSGLPLNQEIDIYNLDNEVTPIYTAYPNTITPITVMDTNKTAITVTTSTTTELLIIGIPD